MAIPRPKLLLGLGILAIVLLIYAHYTSLLRTSSIIFTLPITWSSSTSNPQTSFLISPARDNFDLTFESYPINQTTASIVVASDSIQQPQYEDLIPPILHQIALGHSAKDAGWTEARNACLNHHVGWENHFWTDENAEAFVAEKFPHLKEMWENYRFPIQRVDALRYMILWEFGGAVLDMDLHCRRSLGPLRRFPFVAPEAHPVGFSNGMMMAAPQHPFVGELLRNLPIFNLNWFGLPYATVMFSTGCHYASAIHAIQPRSLRTTLRILSGTPTEPNLHRLNGDVTTPLFHHLGASSWHSYDAFLINQLGHLSPAKVAGMVFSISTLIVVIVMTVMRVRVWRARARGRGMLRLGRSRSSSSEGIRAGSHGRWASRPGTPDSERSKGEGAFGMKSA